MPTSEPVKNLMSPLNQWPQLRAETEVIAAIKILRIITEDKKLEHGHSTPLVFDDSYNLVGFVHLFDLLKAVKPCWEKPGTCEAISPVPKLKDFVVPFAGKVAPEDSIIDALNIMIEHTISLVPVMTDGKLKGVVRLADVFTKVASLLFDEGDPAERNRLMRDHHF
jgi:CBS-domain-containing membrane protein